MKQLDRALALRIAALGAEHTEKLRCQASLGQACMMTAEADRGTRLLEQTLAAQRVQLGPDHADNAATRTTLAFASMNAGRWDQATELLEQALAAQLAKPDADPNEYAKAEPLLRDFVAAQKRLKGANHKDVAGWLVMLGQNCLQQQKWSESEPVLREALAIREAKLPDDWARFNTMSLLGESLFGQKKYALAEPLLLAGCEGMKQREAEIPEKERARLTEALERLDWFDGAGSGPAKK